MDFLIEPAKSAFETVLLGIAANELTSLMSHIYQNGEGLLIGEKTEEDKTNLESIFDASIMSFISNESLSLPTTPENVHKFLNSTEVKTIMRQIYSTKILKDQSSLESVRREFLAIFSSYANVPEEELNDCGMLIFDRLIIACDQTISSAIDEGLLSAHEAKSEFRCQILLDELAAIKKNLDIFAQEKPNIHEIDRFEKKYRQHVADRHGYITPPHFDKTIKLPIDSLYVNPNFIKRPRKRNEESQSLNINEFLSRIYRAVILGVPGAGKSTFASKLCRDLATDNLKRLFAGRQVTPILVVLRDYGTEKKKNNCSIMQYVENKANSNYMVLPPKGAFEYMILNGRAIVIFDGLDELLDTSHRQEISSDIESFCSYYPSVPIIVTSREVGYDQAPLDETRFEVFGLAPFNNDQIAEYARKWFSTDSELAYDQQKEKVASFLTESSIVPDLRSNPLTLSLMCNIYRGENYIPRNRPDVYEKCANMLFERWDRSRGINYSPNVKEIEAHIRPIMAYLAHVIYSNEKMQGGATEIILIKNAADYLNAKQFEDRDEAEYAARNFIEFCRGRAWVFTDIGTTNDGERLYQFTHRTFLEYFTALYLTRIHTTPERLEDVLLPRIAKKEWDVVAQLAFQIQSKNAEDAADSLLSALIEKIAHEKEDIKWNILSFTVRSLEFLVPSPKISRKITEIFLEIWLTWGMRSRASKDGSDREPNVYLRDLLNAASENRKTILCCLETYLLEKIGNGYESEANLALQIVLNMDFSLSDIRSSNKVIANETRDSCGIILRHIHEEHSKRINELCKKSSCNCISAVWADFLSYGNLMEWHGPSILFKRCELIMFAHAFLSPSASSLLMHIIKNPYNSKLTRRHIKKFSRHLEELGSSFIKIPTPWVTAEIRSDIDGSQTSFLEFMEEKKGKKRALPEDIFNSPDALFGFFCLFATYLEIVQADSGILSRLNKSKSSIFDLLRWSFLARFEEVNLEKIRDEMKRCNFSDKQCLIISDWIDTKINFLKDNAK